MLISILEPHYPLFVFPPFIVLIPILLVFRLNNGDNFCLPSGNPSLAPFQLHLRLRFPLLPLLHQITNHLPHLWKQEPLIY